MGIARYWLAALAVPLANAACGQAFTIAGDGGTADRNGADRATGDREIADGPEADRTTPDGSNDAPAFCDDCMNPACASVSECVPDMGGWTPMSFEELTRSPCPDGYRKPTDVVVAGGTQTCTCSSCTGGTVSCSGSFPLSFGLTATSMLCGTTETVAVSPCTVLAKPIAVASNVSVGPAMATVTACVAPTVMTVVPKESDGRMCSPVSVGNKGCSAGEVCVPRPDKRRTCVAAAGAEAGACPSGFPSRYVVAESYSDTRGCAACGCVPVPGPVPTCSSPTAKLFTNMTCAGTLTFAATATCAPAINTSPILAIEYTATPLGGGCGPAASMPTGLEAPGGPETTVCCR